MVQVKAPESYPAGILYPDEGQIRFSNKLLHCPKTALYSVIFRRPRAYTS